MDWEQGGIWTLAEPNTAHGRRSIKLAPTTVQALKTHRVWQTEQRLALPVEWPDTVLVFTNVVGGPANPSNLLHRGFPRILTRAGLPKIRLHDPRHTAATLLLLAGERPKVVQEMLGHSSISLKMDTHSHVLPSMQEDAAAKMERLLEATSS